MSPDMSHLKRECWEVIGPTVSDDGVFPRRIVRLESAGNRVGRHVVPLEARSRVHQQRVAGGIIGAPFEGQLSLFPLPRFEIGRRPYTIKESKEDEADVRKQLVRVVLVVLLVRPVLESAEEEHEQPEHSGYIQSPDLMANPSEIPRAAQKYISMRAAYMAISVPK